MEEDGRRTMRLEALEVEVEAEHRWLEKQFWGSGELCEEMGKGTDAHVKFQKVGPMMWQKTDRKEEEGGELRKWKGRKTCLEVGPRNGKSGCMIVGFDDGQELLETNCYL